MAIYYVIETGGRERGRGGGGRERRTDNTETKPSKRSLMDICSLYYANISSLFIEQYRYMYVHLDVRFTMMMMTIFVVLVAMVCWMTFSIILIILL